MLKKEICKKCWNQYAPDEWKGWVDYDEGRWKEGKIHCPPNYLEIEEIGLRKITDKPPGKCPFLLEHVI